MSSLFKYFPAEYIKDKKTGKRINYALENLNSNTLWASIPDAFNDPFECDFYFTKDDILDYMLLEYPQMKQRINNMRNDPNECAQIETSYSDMQSAMEQIKKQFGITCFSTSDSELLMWGHYANCHRGICAEYDAAEIKKCNGIVRIVNYDTEILRVRDFSPDALMESAEKTLHTKSKEWSYENEVRIIISPIQSGLSGTTWDAPIPKSIRLGVKADERLKAEIKDLCKEKGIDLYQMKKVPGQYAIEKIKIDL